MSADSGAIGRLAIFCVAAALLAATRLPAVSETQALLAAGSVFGLVALASTIILWRKAPNRLRGWLFVLALAAMLVPPSPGSALAWLPDWLSALVFVLALHTFFRHGAQRAPIRGDKARRNALRFLPATAAVAVLLSLPFAMAFLPLRIHAAYELQTAVVPLAAVVLLGSLLVAGGGLRTLLAARSKAPHETQVPEGAEPA